MVLFDKFNSNIFKQFYNIFYSKSSETDIVSQKENTFQLSKKSDTLYNVLNEEHTDKHCETFEENSTVKSKIQTVPDAYMAFDTIWSSNHKSESLDKVKEEKFSNSINMSQSEEEDENRQGPNITRDKNWKSNDSSKSDTFRIPPVYCPSAISINSTTDYTSYYLKNKEEDEDIKKRIRKLMSIKVIFWFVLWYTTSHLTSAECPFHQFFNYDNNILSLKDTEAKQSFNKSCVKRINLNNLHLSAIKNDTFNEFSNLTEINLNNNDIEHLSRTLFAKVPHLKLLSLKGNNITNASMVLPYILSLILSENNIPTLNEDWLSESQNLEILKIDKNQIKVVQPRAFRGLKNLKLLSLSYNRIEHLPSEVFNDTPDLVNLYLDHNFITVVENNIFTSLHNLLTLDLENNLIGDLGSGEFQSLSSLQDLDLAYNQVKIVNEENFKGLTALGGLHLDNNKIEFLGKNAFKDLENLGRLLLSNNSIKQLEQYVFYGLKDLRSLKLDFNEIEILKGSCFSGLDNCYDLNLSHNKIGTLSSEAFVGLHKVEQLLLGGNPLKTMEAGTFSPLKSLYALNLENSGIENLKNLQELPNLRLVELKGTTFQNSHTFIVSNRNFTMNKYGAWVVN
ncbi:hypothetical protein FQA39_LY16147 [Lamprigera yunnana]|nr:hypothetical protein FQA39_LY16147 [Lamprigera yunnana]